MRRRVAVVGDIHLERLRRLLPGDTIAYQLAAIEAVLARCRELRITRLVQAGDLFDNANPDDDTVLRLADLIRAYPEIVWYVLPGNHDRPLLHQHSLKTLRWLGRHGLMNVRVILKPRLVTLAGLRLWLCPHPYLDPQPAGAQLSIGHFAWAGARRDNGTTHPGTTAPAGRWLLADFHTAQRGDRWQYVGSLTQVAWEETGPKGFAIAQLDATEQLSIVKQTVAPPYTLNRLVVRQPADLAAVDPTAADAYWKIYLPPGVTLPDGWQTTYPNIVAREYLGEVAKLKQTVARVQFSDDPMEGLVDYLRDRGNLSRPEVQWALDYLKAG